MHLDEQRGYEMVPAAAGGCVMAVLEFLNRNARVAVVVGVAVAAMGAAGAVGWLTAPTF
jgi:uncharacterized membrane protein (DUF441 family)